MKRPVDLFVEQLLNRKCLCIYCNAEHPHGESIKADSGNQGNRGAGKTDKGKSYRIDGECIRQRDATIESRHEPSRYRQTDERTDWHRQQNRSEGCIAEPEM